MRQVDSRAVSESLESYVRDRLSESDFFTGLSIGQIRPEPLRQGFGPLPRHYGVPSGLEFFKVHENIEVERFRALWEALAQDTRVDARKLIEAARLEIWEHVTFWDDVYSTVLGTQRILTS